MTCNEKNDMRTMLDKVLSALDDEHYHKCPDDNCAHIWSHSSSDFKTDEEHTKGHQCPQCKSRQVWKCNKNGAPL